MNQIKKPLGGEDKQPEVVSTGESAYGDGSTMVRSVTQESLHACKVDPDAKRDRKRRRDNANFTRHDYIDHVNDMPPAYDVLPLTSGDITFALKLYNMLDQVDNDGHGSIMSWQPHGRCFVIHKPEVVDHILAKYFKFSKRSTFQRQLNLYGFKRITAGPDKQGYYHEKFLRGRAFLVAQITRMRIKGKGHRAKANPNQEPDFWSMPWVKPLSQSTTNNAFTCDVQTSSASSVVSNHDESSPVSSSEALVEEKICILGDRTISIIQGENWGRCFYDVDVGSA
eukprot:CAMPEP_0198145346 /NCGR_PEP_ID=MMETSP1443-20131203/22830_1 /TAXON_ID=186043 /ORGANISM="Entomoneis sp., Strain CCMP2396" /LENGTH=281 /DNA_ID=CAMNT_0043808961 /DNA_START=28 /DNA_END=870 /DNA_ORIENTATION=+